MFSYQVDENLKLVLPMPHHAGELAAVVRANHEEFGRWLPWASEDYSVETAAEFIGLNLKRLAEKGEFATLVELDEKIVGSIGFHHLDTNNRSAQLGYWLAEDAQGKGLMTRSAKVLIEYLFEKLDLNRIQINCNVENTKSRAIPERLGFKLEGIHRRVEFRRGRFGDQAIYSMLKEEWRK